MDTVKGKENGSVRLWQVFHAKLVQLGIDPNQADWLVKWAEGFAKSMKGPLASRSAADVLRYLEKTAQAPNIKDWQIKQAVQALQHLYQDQLDADWARKWQWDKAEAHALAILKKPGAAARPTTRSTQTAPPTSLPPSSRGEISPEQGFRDQVGDPAIKSEYAALLGKLRTEIRNRHYSLRTEQAYEGWALRFLTFCRATAVTDPREAAVKAFLKFRGQYI